MPFLLIFKIFPNLKKIFARFKISSKTGKNTPFCEDGRLCPDAWPDAYFKHFYPYKKNIFHIFQKKN